jgi:hypothetical protein
MPETRAGRFSVSVTNWTQKAKEAPDQILRAVCLGLLNNIVTLSPVGNPDLWKHKPPPGYVGGRFRANWFVSIGEATTDTRDVIDPSGQASILSAQAQLDGASCGPPVYIVNNLPYAIPLEYGWSTQSPGGMIRITAVQFQQMVDEAARALQ